MDILPIVMAHNTVLAAAILLVLGLWIYFERPDRSTHQTFAALLITSALWLFTFVFWNAATETTQKLFWFRTLFFIGSLLPALFLLFTLAFIGRFPKTSVQALLLAPALPLAFVAYGLDTFVTIVGGKSIIGDGKEWFAWHFGLMLAGALSSLLYALRTDPAADKRKYGSVAIGSIVAFNTIFTLLFVARIGEGSPEMQWLELLAVVALVAGMMVMAYAVDAKKFLNDLRPVGSEILILIVIFFVAMDIAVAKSSVGITVRVVVLILLIFYGVSAVRAAEREIRRLREISLLHAQLVKVNGNLLEADKLKTKMVSFATHQLRAPIGGARSYLQMLHAGDFGPVNVKQKAVFTTTIDALGRLNDTIETFLDLSKIELGSPEVFKIQTNLAALIGQVVDAVRPLAERKGIDIAVAVPMGLPNLECDSGKLYHAIMNLVHNAINYTERGGIAISASADSGHMTVRVADSGIGLTTDERRKLVDLLAAGMSSFRFDQNGGSGLGLVIVKTIIDAHGGEMIIESSGKGSGATFGFTIPMA